MSEPVSCVVNAPDRFYRVDEMKSLQLTLFEKRVLELCLRGESPSVTALRAQIPDLVVQGRTENVVGFTISFVKVHPKVPVAVQRYGDPPRVYARRSGSTDGALAEFLVWIDQKGAIVGLEGHSMGDDPWPPDPGCVFAEFCNERGEAVE